MNMPFVFEESISIMKGIHPQKTPFLLIRKIETLKNHVEDDEFSRDFSSIGTVGDKNV
jgi:hypothetical protein